MYTGTRTSADYEDLVIFQPNGTERRRTVYRLRSPERQTMPLLLAEAGLESGQEVWVTEGDAPMVRAFLAGLPRAPGA